MQGYGKSTNLSAHIFILFPGELTGGGFLPTAHNSFLWLKEETKEKVSREGIFLWTVSPRYNRSFLSGNDCHQRGSPSIRNVFPGAGVCELTSEPESPPALAITRLAQTPRPGHPLHFPYGSHSYLPAKEIIPRDDWKKHWPKGPWPIEDRCHMFLTVSRRIILLASMLWEDDDHQQEPNFQKQYLPGLIRQKLTDERIIHGRLNASWKICSLVVNRQSFLVIDGYLLNLF